MRDYAASNFGILASFHSTRTKARQAPYGPPVALSRAGDLDLCPEMVQYSIGGGLHGLQQRVGEERDALCRGLGVYMHDCDRPPS